MTPSLSTDPSKQTVSGQITDLLDSDNPYIQQARTAGEMYAHSKGLRNSTMGAEASQEAAIRSALPIAQADAQTHFAANQNQAKFDQDWRMMLAESASNREVEALKQQSGLYAQFTKGVADINAADMKGSEKTAAVNSLWQQFQKGSNIANTLREITINDDGTVSRSGSTPDAATQTAVANNQSQQVAYTFGDGGIYMPGVTTDSDGGLVDKYGQNAPSGKKATAYSNGFDYKLVGGEWERYTLPKDYTMLGDPG